MNDKGIGYGSLKEWFAEVFDNRHKDEIEHLLVLTYEFDDQQLVNLVSGRSLEEDYQIRMSQLKIIASLRPVVLYDSQKTREFNALPHFLELYPVHNRGFSCHHSKAYLLVTRKSVRLLIGSCNLTRSGMFRNREVYKGFLWNSETTNDSGVLSAFTGLPGKGYSQELGSEGADAVAPIISNIRSKMDAWGMTGNNNSDYNSLLMSGYTGHPTGLDQLRSLWGDRKLCKLFVVSPFFDQGSKAYLTREICREIGTPEELCIITDEKNKGAISKYHFGDGIIKKLLRLIPAEISDAERSRIKKANNSLSVKDLVLERPLHAKIIALVGDKDGLVYQGSANFSCKAWQGQNRELGIVNWESNPEALIADICRKLGACGNNVYDILPDKPKDDNCVDDDENPAPDNGFPSFVKRIILHSKTDYNGDKVVCFELISEDCSRLSDYDAFWGKRSIIFKDGLSNTILQKDFFAYLVGNRNLCFKLKSDNDKNYFLPYIYSRSIHVEKEVIIYPDSNDWLDFYLGMQNEPVLKPGEWMPGENNDVKHQEKYDALDVDRESNVVISMQRYLDKFSRIEKEFINKAEELRKLRKKDREKAVAEQIIKPLGILGKILHREWGEQKSLDDSSYLFKIGELVLLTRTISEKIPHAYPLINTLLSYIPADRFKSNKAFKLYRKHIDAVKTKGTYANA